MEEITEKDIDLRIDAEIDKLVDAASKYSINPSRVASFIRETASFIYETGKDVGEIKGKNSAMDSIFKL
jgi:uncharacterized protein (DUF1778 family)